MTTSTDTALPVTLTDDMIVALRSEADSAGDDVMSRICDAAVDGDHGARWSCAVAITSARAMDDETVFVPVVA